MSTSTAPRPLTALLADLSRAGVRPLPPGSAERLAAAASQIGFSCARIDLGDCEDKAALLTRIATALEFPRWFGHNWDALADCLGDLGWRPAKGHVLLLEHAGSFRERHTEDFETLLAILRESAALWAGEQLAFWAFVDLSGPDAG
ncbi:MAG: barstar family protein [Azoarcus sp. PHD]|nr:MAG: barstar family protein [Azoarcus sp. PHD]